MFVIAGASGKTGGMVAKSLLAQGKKVRVLVRDAKNGAVWRDQGADVALTTLENQRGLERALTGAEGFFTLLPDDITVHDFRAHRIRMADAIAAAVKATGVRHVVVLSTTGAYLSESNGPAKELHYLENLLRANASTVTSVRACYLQENVLGVLPAARHQGIYPNFMPSAEEPFPTVATKDVAKVVVRSLLEPPPKSEIIDLLGPTYSIHQLAEGLGARLGKDLRIVDVPPRAHVEALTQAGLPKSCAEAFAEMFACVASGRISPHGDRMLTGATKLDETLAERLPVNA